MREMTTDSIGNIPNSEGHQPGISGAPNAEVALLSGPHHELGRRPGGQQAVLSIRGSVEGRDSASFVEHALETLHLYMKKHDIHPTGRPFAICRPTSNGALDIEAGWPLERYVEGSGQIHGGSMPTALIGHGPRSARAGDSYRRLAALG